MKRAIEPAAADGMTARKVVIPVRYVVRGEAVHTTSTLLSVDGIHVSSIHPPPLGTRVELKLYFPRPATAVSRTALVKQVTPTGFWAEFDDKDELARRYGPSVTENMVAATIQRSPRYPAEARVTVSVADGHKQDGRLTNISASGAFVEIASPPPAGSIIEMEIQFPGHAQADVVQAWVAHVVDGARVARTGIGVQFIDGRANFRLALDGYLAQLRRDQ